MKFKKVSVIIILSLLMIFAAAGCGKQVFDGSSTGNDEQFVLDYAILNCIKTHDMTLEKGTKIEVTIENISGQLDILISDSNGDKEYKGDNAATGKFSIEIPQTDTYKFSVTGRNAKGSVSFKVAKAVEAQK